MPDVVYMLSSGIPEPRMSGGPPRVRHITVGPEGGVPALLLPGNDLCAEFYVPLANVLATRGMRTTVVTLPGFHHQPALPQMRAIESAGAPGFPASWSAMLDAVTPLFGGGVLVGHSLGGLLALLLAARVQAKRLVLLEAAIPPTRAIAKAVANKYMRDVVTADRSTFSNWSGSFHRIHDVDRFPQSAIDLYQEVRNSSDAATSVALVRDMPRLYPLPFKDIRAPVTIVRGAKSGWFNTMNAWAARWRLANTNTVVIEGAAHWLANEDDEALADVISGDKRVANT